MKLDFGSNLAKYRKNRGFTQGQLAKLLSVTPQAISKWEKGSYPDGEMLPKISKVLGVSLDVLFGLAEEKESPDLEELISAKIRQTEPQKRADVVMRLFYAVLNAYNNYNLGKAVFPESLDLETFAELKTDYEIALARLNQDLRYFCFLSIPEKGVNSYTDSGMTENLIRLFRMLADKETLKIIYYLGSGARNRMQSKEYISKQLQIPFDNVSRIMDKLDRMGLVWRVSAEISDNPPIVYGYVYSVPLTMILTLARSLTNYLQHHELYLDLWNTGAFHFPNNKLGEPVEKVGFWPKEEELSGLETE